MAHVDGGVPNMVVNIPSQDAYTLGYTMYFEAAVAISGYLNGSTIQPTWCWSLQEQHVRLTWQAWLRRIN